MSELVMTLTGGGTARLVGLDGDRVKLLASRAAAPGSRLSAALADGRQVRLKVHRSVRAGDQFTVAGRLIDATRELRAFLQRHAASADAR
jgi:hypothetical protein